MSALGEVVFCRDEDNASEIWDDTALIKAYDDAINVVKAQLASDDALQQESGPENITGSHKKHTKGRRKHRKKAANKAQYQPRKWKIGDHCQAVYTEDGEIYRAMIKDINTEEGSCVIRFLGYGNEATQELVDLLAVGTRSRTTTAEKPLEHHQNVQSANESGMEWVGTSPAPHASKDPKKQSTPTENGPSHWPNWGFSPYAGTSAAPPSMPMPMFPGMGMPPAPPPPVFNRGFNRISQSIPNIPPPPPDIDLSDDVASSDKEALYSMLISWYMSGYHTGYYQGLQQGKKAVQSTSSEQNDTEENKR